MVTLALFLALAASVTGCVLATRWTLAQLERTLLLRGERE